MSLLEINKIQINLIKESKMESSDWIKRYSEKFRKIVESGVIEIDKIKNELYK